MEEICWIQTIRVLEDMFEEDRINDILWKFHLRYPRHGALYGQLREVLKKKIKARAPAWSNSPEMDKEYRSVLNVLDGWVIPSSPTYIYSTQEDDVV